MQGEKKTGKNKTQIKVLLGFGVALVIVSIAAILNFSSLNKLTVTLNQVSRPDEKLICTRQLQNFLSDVEDNMRAYTLTHEEKYLASFNSVFDSIHYKVARLKILTNDNDTQFAWADTISYLISARQGVLSSFIEKRKDGFQNKLEYTAAYFEMSEYNSLQSAIAIDSIQKLKTKTVNAEKKEHTEKNHGVIGWVKGLFSNEKINSDSLTKNSDTKISSFQRPNQKNKKNLSVLDVNVILQQQQEILKKQLQVWSLDELILLQEDKNLMDKIHTAIRNLEESEIAIVRKQVVEANREAAKASTIISLIGIFAIISTLLFIYLILTDITKSNQLDLKLEEQRKKAEELAAVKEKFLANMSHEIRTPLNAVIGFTEQLAKENLSPKQERFIEAISHSSSHLLSIINQILDFSRIESGKMQHSPVSFSLADLIKEVHDTLKLKAAEKNLWFSYKIKEDVPEFLKGDVVSMKQILLNLAGNAIKFTKEGSVEMNCSLLLEYGDMANIKIEIKDTGEGIAPEMLEKIFEEFTQADGDITRKHGGTGLGLAISKKLIHLLNGSIAVESNLSVGSTFTIQLPLLKSIAPTFLAQENISAAEINLFRNKSVLLVDDEKMNLLLGKTILENWGVVVVTVTNANDALIKYADQNFDLIILDIQMPEMSGIELAQIIREKEAIHPDSHLPILALTANLYHEQLVNPKEAGFDDVLIKPFMERDLFEKMKLLIATPQENILSEENSVMQQINTDTTQTASIKNPKAIYSLDYLNKTSGSNKEFVSDMIKSFIKNNNEHLAKLNSAIEQNDFDAIMRITHKMIPSYSYLEIKSLIPELKLVKKYADEKINLDKLPSLIHNISSVSIQVMDQLKTEEEKLNLEIKKISNKEISNN